MNIKETIDYGIEELKLLEGWRSHSGRGKIEIMVRHNQQMILNTIECEIEGMKKTLDKINVYSRLWNDRNVYNQALNDVLKGLTNNFK